MADSNLLDIAGVCEVWGVARTKAYELIKLAKIQPVRLHGLADNRYRRSEILAAVLFDGEGAEFLLPWETWAQHGGKTRHPDRLRIIEKAEIERYGCRIVDLPSDHELFAEKVK